MKNKLAFTLAEVLITLVIIGVVAALTIPTAISKYRKTTVETSLKNSYSTLANAVKMSVTDNGDISGWDYSIENYEDFLRKYIFPYVRNAKMNCYAYGSISDICKITLANGTIWQLERFGSNNNFWTTVTVDINGDKKPNNPGYDIFAFHIFGYSGYYNAGDGNLANGVPQQGLYYDGYGKSRSDLFNNANRGCNTACNYTLNNGGRHCRHYCTALIVQNNWKIPDDYPIKF